MYTSGNEEETTPVVIDPSVDIKSVLEPLNEVYHHCVKVHPDVGKMDGVTEDPKAPVKDICNAHGVEVKHKAV